MKTKWSKSWKSSIQPRKQRKYRLNGPFHIKRKFLSVHLSKTLRNELKRRAVPVRKGDEVKILRGEKKGIIAKVVKVSVSKGVIYLEKQTKESVSGRTSFIPFQPSNLLITKLNKDDKLRFKKG